MDKIIDVSRFFDSREVKEMGEKTSGIVPRDLNRLQKTAIIKAVLYVISADNVITSEEQDFLVKLMAAIEADESMLKDASALTDEAMFSLLQEVNDNQDDYLASCLSNAAMADQHLADEEAKLLNVFRQYIPEGKKPEDFYNRIINF